MRAVSLEARQIGILLETMEASFFIHPLLLLPPACDRDGREAVPPLPALLGDAIEPSARSRSIELARRRDRGRPSGYASETGSPRWTTCSPAAA
jgi:hypothetical protein